MKIKNDQSNEVAIKKPAGAVAAVNIEQFADEGFDNVDSKSLALPFLKVLGQLSPQVTQGNTWKPNIRTHNKIIESEKEDNAHVVPLSSID